MSEEIENEVGMIGVILTKEEGKTKIQISWKHNGDEIIAETVKKTAELIADSFRNVRLAQLTKKRPGRKRNGKCNRSGSEN